MAAMIARRLFLLSMLALVIGCGEILVAPHSIMPSDGGTPADGEAPTELAAVLVPPSFEFETTSMLLGRQLYVELMGEAEEPYFEVPLADVRDLATEVELRGAIPACPELEPEVSVMASLFEVIGAHPLRARYPTLVQVDLPLETFDCIPAPEIVRVYLALDPSSVGLESEAFVDAFLLVDDHLFELLLVHPSGNLLFVSDYPAEGSPPSLAGTASLSLVPGDACPGGTDPMEQRLLEEPELAASLGLADTEPIARVELSPELALACGRGL